MPALFTWLDSHPAFFWLCAVLATAALVAWVGTGLRLALREQSLRGSGLVFGVLLFLFFLAWRWPYLLCAAEYNPDESQFIAGALTLTHDPVFWRSVDGVTSGPLDFYTLLPLHWLGLPLDYFGARLTALVLTWGTLLFLYRTFRAYAAPAVAQLAVLPGAVFFAASVAPDFVHYSSELTPLAVLALALSLLRRHPLLAAFVGGWLPWAKLQAAPIAATLVLWLLWQGWRETPPGAPRPWRRAAALVGAAAAPSLLVVSLVVAFGQWEHFYRRFFLQNVAYVSGGQPKDVVLRDLWRFTNESVHVLPWLAMVILVLALAGILYRRQRAEPPPNLWAELSAQARKNGLFTSWIAAALLMALSSGVIYVRERRRLPAQYWLGLLLTLAAVVCIITPSRSSLHYLFFLTVPLTYWSGMLVCDLWNQNAARPLLAGLALLCAFVPLGVRSTQPRPAMIGQLAEHWRQPYSPVGEVLRAWNEPGASLAVWGWMSHAFVEASLPQAARDTVSQWCILDVPQRDYYRETFFADLKRNHAEIFIDAVGPGAAFFPERALQAHEIYPELADYIRQHYLLVVDLQVARIYVRKDFHALHPVGINELQQRVARGRRDFASPVAPDVTNPATLPSVPLGHQTVKMIEPPAELRWNLKGNERSVRVDFGIHPKSYTEGVTDGAEFIGELHMPGQPPLQVLHRLLDPQHQPGDRGPLAAEADLPPYPPGTALVLRTSPGKAGNTAWDWVYLEALRFARSPFYSPRQFPGFSRIPDRLESAYPYIVRHDQARLLMLPPPSTLIYILAGDERHLNFTFGLQQESYTPPGQTDGAVFAVDLLREGAAPRNIYSRRLDPLGVPEDRGPQSADLILPADVRASDRIVIRVEQGGNSSWDWTYILALDLR